jgi:hypothetical protein
MDLIISDVPLTHDELEEMKKAPRVKISYELLYEESKEGEVIKVIQSLSSVTFSLKLSCISLSFSRLQRIIETVLSISTITELDLNCNNIRGEEAIQFAGLFANNTTLTRLDLLVATIYYLKYKHLQMH